MRELWLGSMSGSKTDTQPVRDQRSCVKQGLNPLYIGLLFGWREMGDNLTDPKRSGLFSARLFFGALLNLPETTPDLF